MENVVRQVDGARHGRVQWRVALVASTCDGRAEQNNGEFDLDVRRVQIHHDVTQANSDRLAPGRSSLLTSMNTSTKPGNEARPSSSVCALYSGDNSLPRSILLEAGCTSRCGRLAEEDKAWVYCYLSQSGCSRHTRSPPYSILYLFEGAV